MLPQGFLSLKPKPNHLKKFLFDWFKFWDSLDDNSDQNAIFWPPLPATPAEKDAHLFILEQQGRETWVTGTTSRGTLWSQSGREKQSLSFMSETLKRVLWGSGSEGLYRKGILFVRKMYEFWVNPGTQLILFLSFLPRVGILTIPKESFKKIFFVNVVPVPWRALWSSCNSGDSKTLRDCSPST